MNGLSIANNLLASRVEYNLENNQAALKSSVEQLSSGLRINSAADDPSGLAIATSLQTQVSAFQTASQNVQTANNAAQVADGALATETDILQRIRNLAVEASSSLSSTSDSANLQAEVSQLLLEVNRISQSVTFNGAALLDGSHAGFQPYTSASYSVTSNTVLANGGFITGGLGSGLSNGDFANPNTGGGLLIGAPAGWGSSGLVAVYGGPVGTNATPAPGQQAVIVTSGSQISQTISGLTPGAQYELTLQAANDGNTNTLQVSVNGNDVSPAGSTSLGTTFATYTTQTFTSDASGNAGIVISSPVGFGDLDVANVALVAVPLALPPGAGNLVAGVTAITTTAAGLLNGGSTIFDTTNSGAVDGTIELQVVNTSSTTVGVDVQFFSSAASGASAVTYYASAAANTLVSVDGLNVTIGNVGVADAGTTAYIKVSQAVAASSAASGAFTIQSGSSEGDTVQMGIAATNAQTMRISNINIANTNSPVIAAEDAIGQIDNALQMLLDQRAQLGAVIVRLNEDAQNDSVAAVNLQASESAIRDLNVDQATTNFTREQVLNQIGNSVLAQSNANAESVLGLLV